MNFYRVQQSRTSPVILYLRLTVSLLGTNGVVHKSVGSLHTAPSVWQGQVVLSNPFLSFSFLSLKSHTDYRDGDPFHRTRFSGVMSPFLSSGSISGTSYRYGFLVYPILWTISDTLLISSRGEGVPKGFKRPQTDLLSNTTVFFVSLIQNKDITSKYLTLYTWMMFYFYKCDRVRKM